MTGAINKTHVEKRREQSQDETLQMIQANMAQIRRDVKVIRAQLVTNPEVGEKEGAVVIRGE